MFSYQTFQVWPLLRETVTSMASCWYVFGQCVPLILFFRNYSWCLKILTHNILLSENKSTRQQSPTPNFECFVAKHNIMFAFLWQRKVSGYACLLLHRQQQQEQRSLLMRPKDCKVVDPKGNANRCKDRKIDTSLPLLQVPRHVHCLVHRIFLHEATFPLNGGEDVAGCLLMPHIKKFKN